MFWGCVVKENKPFEIKSKIDGVLHLSEACLNPNAGDGKIYLQLHEGANKFNICVLKKDSWETQRLEHFLHIGADKTYKLSLVGGGNNTEVSVTGYTEVDDNEGIIDDISELEAEVEDEIPELVPVDQPKKT